MKSKSGWLAAGKPTSISLKPIFTRALNMRILRSGSIGSIRAWLPSRRSTLHHSGALSIVLSGQVRSASEIGRKRSYLPNGIGFGVAGCGGIGVSVVRGSCVWIAGRLAGKMKNPPAVRRGVRASARCRGACPREEGGGCLRETSPRSLPRVLPSRQPARSAQVQRHLAVRVGAQLAGARRPRQSTGAAALDHGEVGSGCAVGEPPDVLEPERPVPAVDVGLEPLHADERRGAVGGVRHQPLGGGGAVDVAGVGLPDDRTSELRCAVDLGDGLLVPLVDRERRGDGGHGVLRSYD